MLKALKSTGVTELAATGYCFGGNLLVSNFIDALSTSSYDLGRYKFDPAFENIIKAAVVARPYLIKVPEDFEVRCVYFRLSIYAVLPYVLFHFLFPFSSHVIQL